MKMTQENYNTVKKEFERIKSESPEAIKKAKIIFSNSRMAWDIFWCANNRTGNKLLNQLYLQGLHDSHIETALMKICKELEII